LQEREAGQKDYHIATGRQHSLATARLMIPAWILLFQLPANNTVQIQMENNYIEVFAKLTDV
jgi:hypothetical protein